MKRFALLTLLVALLLGCSKVPITGRKQINLLPESDLLTMSYQQYGEFLNANKVIHPPDPQAEMVKRCGDRIAVAVEEFLKKHNQLKRVEGFEWQFELVDDELVNAWCMPGGKVVFYTGILPITQDEVGLAVVMGHEVAHAVARHGNERMSQGTLLQTAGASLGMLMQTQPQATSNLFMQSYGVASGLGAMAFSRQHETEADKMGLVFMAMAGYDPNEAPKFWQRMQGAGGGGKPPEFLSTHPSDERRINDLNEYMPEAMKHYKPK